MNVVNVSSCVHITSPFLGRMYLLCLSLYLYILHAVVGVCVHTMLHHLSIYTRHHNLMTTNYYRFCRDSSHLVDIVEPDYILLLARLERWLGGLSGI